ncbi:hypothetical protein SAMN06265349_101629 [Flavobacterium resistens]|uniref:Lipoprotein n=1 Tax=Flavobacterium resistens TaxID=443612 RepID=A0A521B2U5_9FLAO|nr:hypothetical protein [Flavobacterium resistens]MRX70333.1 hypothetical protein [Flavobacterium resistens]SMO41369.1 hypothetical protein SAMN06265349_101629 [Flavobacterium resistens]
MKYFTLIIAFILFSCGEKKDVLLPKSNVTIVKDIQDHSPIYIFFKVEAKDTIADVNRKNSIISTNWIFNIDKRLPLKLVIPEVMKLQEKKRGDSAHKNENAQNYYSYADSIGKNLAFLPFTKVHYKMEIANNRSQLYFKKNGMIKYSGGKAYDFPKSNLKPFLDSLVINPKAQITFSYDKNMSYEEYIQCKILVKTIIDKKIPFVFINEDEEFIF